MVNKTTNQSSPNKLFDENYSKNQKGFSLMEQGSQNLVFENASTLSVRCVFKSIQN